MTMDASTDIYRRLRPIRSHSLARSLSTQKLTGRTDTVFSSRLARVDLPRTFGISREQEWLAILTA